MRHDHFLFAVGFQSLCTVRGGYTLLPIRDVYDGLAFYFLQFFSTDIPRVSRKAAQLDVSDLEQVWMAAGRKAGMKSSDKSWPRRSISV